MQARAQAPGTGRQAHAASDVLQAQALAQHRLQQFQPAAITCGNPHALAPCLVRHAVLRVVAHVRAVDAIDLVEHQQLRQLAGADRFQHFVHLGDALLAQRIGGIHQVQQEIGLARLAQGGTERGHQLVRQVADEADGVGQHRIATGQRDAAHGRVQRGEQLVGGIRAGTGQCIEQGGLAGVGVAHQGHARHFAAHARTAHLGALHFHLFQPLLQLLHALLQQPAVGFQLGFAGAAQADGAAALALKVGPAAHQPRGQVAQLRQLHLQLAFVAVRTLGEDVQDQAGTVDHPAFEEALQVAFLHRAELVVDQDQVGAGGLGGGLHFIQLAAADQGGRIRAIDAGADRGRNAGPGRTRQIGEFFQYVFFQPPCVRLDQQRMFAAFGAVKHALPPAYSLSSSPAWLLSPDCT